ncbi:MAG: DUF6204 family protein [Acidimicrobiales bacterium]
METGTAGSRTYRVTVRGRFQGLTDAAQAHLRAHLAEHDVFLSRFSGEGSLSYDHRLDFFNLRYEVRLGDGGGTERVAEVALTEATAFLRTLRLGHGELRSEVMDLQAMTDHRRARRRAR